MQTLVFLLALAAPAPATGGGARGAPLRRHVDRLVSPASSWCRQGDHRRRRRGDPAGREVIELGDATLLPGFIDAHTTSRSSTTTTTATASSAISRRRSPSSRTRAPPSRRRTLLAGFTTCRDLGSDLDLDLGLRNAINRGKVPGPRPLVARHALGATGGHCDVSGFRKGVLADETTDAVADSPDGFRAAVRRQLKYGADVIKICAHRRRCSPSPTTWTRRR
jgi:imidazolonepropionase-like amidohydrolase